MKLTGSQLAVRALEDEGIRFAFGIPGTHNIELYDALAASERVRAVLVTDEQSAGFMADAVWRATGELACANLVPGAGLTHALSGIAEAYLDTVPMLVLGCGIRRDLDRAYQLHDIDQLALAAPVTKAALRTASGGEIYRTIREACALARSGCPGPVLVEIPVEQYLQRHEAGALSVAPAVPSVPHPDPAALQQAVALLKAPGARVLLYVGLGALGAADRLPELAERLGAPVATTLQGKGVFPESHPLFLGNMLGEAAPDFVREETRRATVMLAIGCRFSEVGTGSWGFEPPPQLIHADIDAQALGRNFPATVSLHADANEFVRALLERVPPERRDAPALGERLRAGHATVQAARLEVPVAPARVRPAVLLPALQQHFGPRTVFTSDSGNGTFLAMEILRLDAPRRFLAPVDYSCMGYAVPAAIAAKLAEPTAPVVALAGDGAFLMTGLELLTAANQGAAVAVVVLRDRELAQIAQFQSIAFNRKAQSVLPDYDVAGLAAGMGVECLQLASESDIDAVLGEARAITSAGRPVLVDTAIDYSQKTQFTRGVVAANLARLGWSERLRLTARALGRRILG